MIVVSNTSPLTNLAASHSINTPWCWREKVTNSTACNGEVDDA